MATGERTTGTARPGGGVGLAPGTARPGGGVGLAPDHWANSPPSTPDTTEPLHRHLTWRDSSGAPRVRVPPAALAALPSASRTRVSLRPSLPGAVEERKVGV